MCTFSGDRATINNCTVCCRCWVASVVSDSVWPQRRQPTRLPPSLGFSRQEHWSGLPFPSPMCESKKWKRSCSVMSNSSQPHGLQPTRLLHPWDFPGKSTGVGCHCLLQCRKVKNETEVIQLSPTLRNPMARLTSENLFCYRVCIIWIKDLECLYPFCFHVENKSKDGTNT